jgi:hypothetical protein
MHENELSPTGKSAPATNAREQSAIPPESFLQNAGPSSVMSAIPRTDCGDFDIRIARDGSWFYKNTPIGRPALVKLFASVLKRDAEGDYWLETPAERGRIVVEDAPFVAVEVDFAGDGAAQRVIFRTNLDQRVTLDAAHPLDMRGSADGEPRPYLRLDGGLEALIARSVFYGLVERAVPRVVDGVEMLGVWSDGAFFALGPVPASETAS